MSNDSKIQKLLNKMIVDAQDLQKLCDVLKNRFKYFDEFDDGDELMSEITKVEKDINACLKKLKKEI